MNHTKHILIAILLASLLCGLAAAAWANTSYSNAKDITLLGADTELSNYPYLVSVTKESAMQSDFDDLIFYDQPVNESGNLIDFEIETYNSTVATVWLNITTLPSVGKTVSVYYGNAGASSTADGNATWNDDYVGVWHLSDDILGYAGSSHSSSILSQYSCWGIAHVQQDPNNLQEYIITWQQLPPDGDPYKARINFSVYNATLDSYSTVTSVFDNANQIQQGHATWDYFGGKYHVAMAQTIGEEDFVVDINSTTWEGLQNHVLTSNEYQITPDLGWRTIPSYLKINESSIWMLCANRYDGGNAYGGYTAWDSVDGWGEWTKIPSMVDSDCLTSIRGVVKDDVIYLYYTLRNPYAFYMIKSSDYGATWSTLANLGLPYLDIHSTPSVHIRNDIFVVIYGTEEISPNQMLMYRSDNGETFTDAEVVVSEAGFPHDWAWINDTHILLTYPDVNSFVGESGDLDTGILNVGNYLAFQSDNTLVMDSTSNDNDGIADGGESLSNGIIGGAINFTEDHIAINTNDFYNIGTVSWWQNTPSSVGGMAFTGNYNVTDSHASLTMGKDADNKAYHNSAVLGYTLRSDAGTVQVGASQQMVWTSDGSTAKCFIDGANSALTTTEGTNVGYWFSDIENINKYGIGSLVRAAQEYVPFVGIIDQVELSKSVRSDDWINLSYMMVTDDSYVSFGSQQTYGSTGGGAYNITLLTGWNIIGWTPTAATTAHSMGGLIGGNCTYVTERNTTTGNYINHNMAGPESVNNFAILRGWGYFVDISAETFWERAS